MTRKEKQKLMLDTLGLKAGDVVKIKDDGNEEAEIIERENDYCLLHKNKVLEILYSLILYDFIKIVPKKKKVSYNVSILKTVMNALYIHYVVNVDQ